MSNRDEKKISGEEEETSTPDAFQHILQRFTNIQITNTTRIAPDTIHHIEQVTKLARDVAQIKFDNEQSNNPLHAGLVRLLHASQRLIERLLNHQAEQQSAKNVRHAQSNELMQENAKLRRLLQVHQNIIAHRAPSQIGGETSANNVPNSLPCPYCPAIFTVPAKFAQHFELRHSSGAAKEEDTHNNNATRVTNHETRMVEDMRTQIEGLTRRLEETQNTLSEERHARHAFEHGISVKLMEQVKMLQLSLAKDEPGKLEQAEVKNKPEEIQDTMAKDDDRTNLATQEETKTIPADDSNKASIKQKLLDELVAKRMDRTKEIEITSIKNSTEDDGRKMEMEDITNALEHRLNSYLNNRLVVKADVERTYQHDDDDSQHRFQKAMDEVKRDRSLLIEQSRHDYNFVEIEDNIRNQIDTRLQSRLQEDDNKGNKTSPIPIAVSAISSSRFTLRRVTEEDLKREEEEEQRHSRSLSTSPLKSILKPPSSEDGIRNRSRSLSAKPTASQLSKRRISFNDELMEYPISPLSTSPESSDDGDNKEAKSESSKDSSPLFTFESSSGSHDDEDAIVFIENPR